MLFIDDRTLDSAKNIGYGSASLFSVLEKAAKSYDVYAIEQTDAQNALPKRNRVSHKGTYGRTAQICGSYGMAGAAVIAAKAAYLTGIGLVDGILPDGIYPIVATAVPEAIFCPLPCSDTIKIEHLPLIYESLTKADSLLIGCGISDCENTKNAVPEIIKSINLPTVIDADGINCLSHCIQILEQTAAETIITPHLGEMANLIETSVNDVMADFAAIAADFAVNHNTVTVLKSAFTVVATPNGKVYVNLYKGNAGMAVAGSGDMLSGIISALLAQGIRAETAAKAAVYLHAEAGDMAADVGSIRSVTPTAMLEVLPCLFKKYE